jgi:hypothetical protein
MSRLLRDSAKIPESSVTRRLSPTFWRRSRPSRPVSMPALTCLLNLERRDPAMVCLVGSRRSRLVISFGFPISRTASANLNATRGCGDLTHLLGPQPFRKSTIPAKWATLNAPQGNDHSVFLCSVSCPSRNDSQAFTGYWTCFLENPARTARFIIFRREIRPPARMVLSQSSGDAFGGVTVLVLSAARACSGVMKIGTRSNATTARHPLVDLPLPYAKPITLPPQRGFVVCTEL